MTASSLVRNGCVRHQVPSVKRKGAVIPGSGTERSRNLPRSPSSRDGVVEVGRDPARIGYDVWIAERRQGVGPTGRVKVQYSSTSCGVLDPSTSTRCAHRAKAVGSKPGSIWRMWAIPRSRSEDAAGASTAVAPLDHLSLPSPAP